MADAPEPDQVNEPGARAVPGPADAAGPGDGAEPAEFVDPLRLAACPECGYALDGLPDDGRCPECGRAYDRAELTLFGSALGTTAGTAKASRWKVAGHAAFLGLIIVGNMGVLAVMRPRDPVVRVLMVLLLAQAGFFLFARLTAPVRATVRVRLGAAGASQEPADPSDAMAGKLLSLYSGCMPGAMLLLCAAATERAGWRLPLALTGGAAMLLAVMLQTVGPIRRAAAGLLRTRPAAVTAGPADRTPWSEIGDVALDEQAGSNRYHLRARRLQPWPSDAMAVSAEVTLTPEQAAALRERIDAWRGVPPASPSPSDPPPPPLPSPEGAADDSPGRQPWVADPKTKS